MTQAFVGDQPTISATFETLTEVAKLPGFAQARTARHQFLDLAGDGQQDCVVLERPNPGFYKRTEDQDWQNFLPLTSIPNVDWNDPNLRFVDLNGDGHADVLVTEHDVFTWYPSLAEAGFDTGLRVAKARDEETGPAIVFADGTQSIFLADMTGDGLSDIVRIRNGAICYWPNIGYGQFGAKIAMDNSPWFDAQDHVRPAPRPSGRHRRIGNRRHRLSRRRIGPALFQSGRQWLERPASPAGLPARRKSRLRAGDGLAGQRHVMPRLDVVAARRYAPQHALCRSDGRPEAASAHIDQQQHGRGHQGPVRDLDQVLSARPAGGPPVGHQARLPRSGHRAARDPGSRLQHDARQHLSLRPRLLRRRRARVPRLRLRRAARRGIRSSAISICRRSSPRPGSTTARGSRSTRSRRSSRTQPTRNFSLAIRRRAFCPTPILPTGLSDNDTREAARALKGSILRQEVYSDDGTPKAALPYSVSERSYRLTTVQPQGPNRHAVFFSHPCETIDYHYERNPADPRISHALTLEVDAYGNVLRSAAIGYQRRTPAFDEQGKTLATLTESQFTNAILADDAYRTPLPAEVKTFELTAPTLTGATALDFATIDAIATAATAIAYEAQPDPSQANKRLLSQVRTLYRTDDLSAFLPLAQVESLALPGESYKRALTPGLLAVYQAKISAADLTAILAGPQGQYRDIEGDGPFWIASGQTFLSPGPTDTPAQELAFAQAHFYLPHRYVDPFGANSVVAYDQYDLSVASTTDAVGNVTTAVADYRVLQPTLVTDPNGNRSQALFDALGMLAGTAVQGKAAGPVEGDSFDYVHRRPLAGADRGVFRRARPARARRRLSRHRDDAHRL